MSTLTTRKRTDAGKVIAQRFGHCIATHGNVYGLTQKMLSERLSVDTKPMVRVERGDALPSLQPPFAISKALDVTVSQLLSEALSSDRDLVDWLGQRLRRLPGEDGCEFSNM